MVPSALVPLHVPVYFPEGSAAASASAENKSSGISRRMGANLSKNRGPRGTIILALEEEQCKAEENLERAVRRHGERSRQAQDRRRQLEEARERCHHDRDRDRH